MDPVSAFAIACGVLQVVEVGVGAAKAYNEIPENKNALTSEMEHLRMKTQGIRDLSSQLVSRYQSINSSQAQLDQEKVQLLRIAKDCNEVARNLCDRLDKLSLPGASKRQVLKQWWRIQQHKEEVHNDRTRLERLGKLLDTQMLVKIYRDLDTSQEQQTKLLEQCNLSQIQTTDMFKQMSSEFQTAFCDALSRIQQHVTNEVEVVRQLISRQHLKDQDRDEFQRLLDSLGFPTMTSRQEEVQEPYPDTFEWILDPKPEVKQVIPDTGFIEWLAKGQTIYWIRGKPGSGKSTLMNFLIQQPKLRKTLESWAEGKKLILGSFFFKLSTDNQDQKSITGLLRSLLHQLLSEHPPFIEYIDPVMRSAKKIWSDKSLRSALRAIARECERENVKMCIFLDGLDEFENVEGLENFESHGVEQQPLVDLIEELVQGDCIKAIVSSREETLFVTRFSGYKQLCLQNLTFEDIQSYVKARLLQEQAMVIWKKFNPREFDNFVAEITEKATGVFLWARLTVSHLLNAVLGNDTPAMLQERLRDLSPSLDGLFERLLNHLDQYHQIQAARYLHFEKSWTSRFSKGQVSLSILDMIFAFEPDLNRNLQELILSNEAGPRVDKAVGTCIESLQNFETSLTSRCAGFLDIGIQPHSQLPRRTNRYDREPTPTGSASTDTGLSPLLHHCYKLQNFVYVRLIHRSAWDFLQRNQKGSNLLQKAAWTNDVWIMMLSRAAEGAALIGLATFQDSFTTIVFPGDIDHSRQEHDSRFQSNAERDPRAFGTCSVTQVVDPEDYMEFAGRWFLRTPKGFDDSRETGCNAFKEFFPLALYEGAILGPGQTPATRAKKLNELCRWLTLCLERLVSIMRQKQILLGSSPVWNPCEQAFSLATCVPAQHIGLWLMLLFSETICVLEIFDEPIKPSSSFLFDAAMYALWQIDLGLNPYWRSDVSITYDTVYNNSDASLSKGEKESRRLPTREERLISGLKLIKRFLSSGLDPNAEVEDTCKRAFVKPVHEIRPATRWQRYLAWFDFYSLQGWDLDGTPAVDDEAWELIKTFLERKADIHTPLSIYLSSVPPRYEEMSEPGFEGDWFLHLEYSVLQVLQGFSSQASTTHDLSNYFETNNPCPYASKLKILVCMGGISVVTVLDFFTEEQQQQLSRLARLYKDNKFSHHRINDQHYNYSFRVLDDCLLNIWSTNLEHIREAREEEERLVQSILDSQNFKQKKAVETQNRPKPDFLVNQPTEATETLNG